MRRSHNNLDYVSPEEFLEPVLVGVDLEQPRFAEAECLIHVTWVEDYPALALALNLVPSEACAKL